MTEIRVLGPVEVVDHSGDPITIGGPRQRRLLAVLASEPGHALADGRLSDVVWPDGDAPEDPRNALQTYVSRLRAAGVSVERSGSGYSLAPDAAQLDSRLFEQELATGERLAERGDSDAAAVVLETALGRWRGPAYGDFADEEWARGEGIRLEELRIRGRERLAELAIDRGRASESLADLRALCAQHPLRDTPHRLLMLASFEIGDQAEALRIFQDFRTRLADETGLEPADEFVALERQIATGEVSSRSTVPARLGSYEVGDLIGEGAFGSIYRAAQPSVGRDVAIKVVRPELANNTSFVRRFEVEAQTVARLEHPHIVPLYDYWRDPSGAYLVMRYLAGGSAEQRLTRDGPWSLVEVARLVDEIGAALAVAHDAGVLHRDIKPANVLFDEQGNSYLADFGIASEVGSQEATDLRSAGSPLYVSPEQVRDGEATPASDIYAFGVVLYELLTGRPPFADSDSVRALLERKVRDRVPSISPDRPDVPPAVDLVIQTATAADPVQRFPSMGELVLAFRSAIADGPGIGNTTAETFVDRPRSEAARTLVGLELESVNPYKGLAAFDESDTSDFFGRDNLVGELVERLAGSRFVVVTGPSGSGKSSVVRAGLLPKLRASGSFVASIVPGRYPMDELETALLRVATQPTGALLEQLSSDERGLARAIKTLLPDDESELILVVDQFEELFTITDAEHRDRFLSAIAAAVSDERSRLRVVCTLRADFYDRPLQHPAITELVRVNTVAVSPLTGEQLDEAITRPASGVGVTVEPALVAELVADASGHAALPMLQYALSEVYERRSGARMTLDSYREIGGVSGALANRADELFDAMSPADRDAARRLFTRLVTPGEGTEDTRRRVLRSEVAGVPASVIDAYGSARLLTFDRDPATREPTVEVAHEALIREWPQLRVWLDEDRDGLRLMRHLGLSAEAWVVSGREAGELYRGGRLEGAEEWATHHASDLTPLEGEFLEASVAQRAMEEAAERRRVQRLRVLLAVTAVVALIALIAGVVALQQRSDARANADAAAESEAAALVSAEDADAQRLVAESEAAEAELQRQLAQESEAEALTATELAEQRRLDAEHDRLIFQSATLVGSDRRAALLMAVEAYSINPDTDALGALQRAMVLAPRNWMGFINSPTLEPYRKIEFLPSGDLAAVSPSGLDIWPLGEGEQRLSIAADGEGTTVATSVDRVAIGSADGHVGVYRVSDGEITMELDVGTPITALTLSSNGELLAVGTRIGTQVVRVADKSVLIDHPLQPTDGTELDVKQLVFDPTDRMLAVSAGHFAPATVLDVASGEPLVTDLGVGTTVQSADTVAWHADGLLVASFDEVAIFETESWTPVHASLRIPGTWSGGGAASTTPTGSVALLNPAGLQLVSVTAAQVTQISADLQHGRAESVAISLDGSVIAVSGTAGISLFSTTGGGTLAAGWLPGNVLSAEITDDGSLTIVSNPNVGPPMQVWDTSTPSRPEFVSSIEQYGKARERDGIFVLNGPPVDGPWTHAVLRNGEISDHTEVYPYFPSNPLAVSPDGSLLFESPTGSSLVVVFDTESRTVVAELDDIAPSVADFGSDRRYAPDIELHPDGERFYVMARSGHVFEYDLATLELIGERFTSEEGFHGLAFTSDGEMAVTLNFTSRLLELRTGDTLEVLASAPVTSGFLSIGAENPDILAGDRYAVIGGAPGGATLWDLETLEQIGEPFPHVTDFRQPGVASDAKILATTVEGGAVLWNVDVEQWPEMACRAAGRNMTLDEWEQFGPHGEPYRATCPQWPSLG